MKPPPAPQGERPRRKLAGEAGIVTAFLVKLVVGLVVAAFILSEAGQIIFARISAEDVADQAATAAAGEYDDSGDIREAHRAAVEVVMEGDAKIKKNGGFVLNPEDGSIRVVVRKRADTLLVDKIGFMAGLTVAEGKAVGRPPTG